LALGCTLTVPAQSFCAPALARLIAAARVIPGVCGVFRSSSPALTMRTPWSRQSVPLAAAVITSSTQVLLPIVELCSGFARQSCPPAPERELLKHQVGQDEYFSEDAFDELDDDANGVLDNDEFGV